MYSEWFSNQIDKLAKISRVLAEKREISFYGLEESYITPKEAISKESAEKSFRDARYVLKIAKN